MTGDLRRTIHCELRQLINRNSLENDSNTPDFLLADYLISCLDAWNDSIARREEWYGRVERRLPVSLWPEEIAGKTDGQKGTDTDKPPRTPESWATEIGKITGTGRDHQSDLNVLVQSIQRQAKKGDFAL